MTLTEEEIDLGQSVTESEFRERYMAAPVRRDDHARLARRRAEKRSRAGAGTFAVTRSLAFGHSEDAA